MSNPSHSSGPRKIAAAVLERRIQSLKEAGNGGKPTGELGRAQQNDPQQAAVAELPLVKGNFTTDDEEQETFGGDGKDFKLARASWPVRRTRCSDVSWRCGGCLARHVAQLPLRDSVASSIRQARRARLWAPALHCLLSYTLQSPLILL